MAVSTTTRMLLTRWSAGADPVNRTQFDTTHANLEARAAGRLTGTLAARPAASSVVEGFLYEVTSGTDVGCVYYCTPTPAWILVSGPHADVLAHQFEARGVAAAAAVFNVGTVFDLPGVGGTLAYNAGGLVNSNRIQIPAGGAGYYVGHATVRKIDAAAGSWAGGRVSWQIVNGMDGVGTVEHQSMIGFPTAVGVPQRERFTFPAQRLPVGAIVQVLVVTPAGANGQIGEVTFNLARVTV